MRKIFLELVVTAMLATACNNDKKVNESGDTLTYNDDDGMVDVPTPEVREGTYVNLASGEEVSIVRDSITGIAIDRKTQIPVEFYYDPVTMDTLYQNGMVVNHLLVKEGDGKYKLDDMKIKIDGDKIKIKTDSSKLKVDGDEMKMKAGDDKMKVDGEETKVKTGDGKLKVDGKDGKLKTEETKIKVEDGDTKVKPRN